MLSTKNIQLILGFLGLILLGYILWNVRLMIYSFFAAIILAFIARPLMSLLGAVSIKQWKLPNAMRAGLVLALIIGVVTSIIRFMAPIVVHQADILSQIDTNGILVRIQNEFANLPSWLVSDKDVSSMIQEEVNQLIDISDVGSYIISILGGISSTLISLFSVFFISFFLLKDGQIMDQIIASISPEKYLSKVNTIVMETKDLLSRYFIGVLAQITVIILVISIGLSILGVQNALLIGVIAGVFNIIPYIGPLMGAGIGLLLAATSQLEVSPDAALFGFLMSAIIPFVVAQLLDNFLLQPLIFSKSVKAHPLEIFMVILAAGSLGGIMGMIVAVPTYSFIRIIAKEFFNGYKIVQGLTKDL